MIVNNFSSAVQERPSSLTPESAASREQYIQDPIAIVGLACRLPGNNNTPTALWEFLCQGGCAGTQPPLTRFTLGGHYDGSKRPQTMRSPGGMFLEDIDPRDIDAQFFKLSRAEAVSMDPQQRQLLEVIYEGLENAGISLEALNGQSFGCFVGSYASDYGDIQSRDPEDRVPSMSVGVGRAMLSNRVSHFLNIKGPSMTIDTACSGSLVAVDIACRYLQTKEINGAIIAGCNLYLSPEHNMDYIAMSGTASSSGKCHTFDIKADGYIKAEAVNMVVLKRLDDAIRNGDPIRAVIRGSATNSDGWTAGIASPSSAAQATAIRQAYANANISDLNATGYLECHGTATQAGDPIEAAGVASVFSGSRRTNQPLIIGSIKSNIGHSEPAAGISGLLKAVLALENAVIPGNPTFETPNPKIDFHALKLRVLKSAARWPDMPFRRASVNSFGFGGSNAHVVLDDSNQFLEKHLTRHVSSYLSDTDDPFLEERTSSTFVLIFSANDENSLRNYCKKVVTHLINPQVRVSLADLAYTLSERRTRHFHRAYILSQSCKLDELDFVFGKKLPDAPRIAFVFTGQGAQWSQMAKDFVNKIPTVMSFIKRLDDVLHSLPDPPKWSLLEELVEPRTPEWLSLPELSQPLVTALQLVLLDVLDRWGVHCQSVVGHSSGEIAAATAAGYLTPEQAIKIAYYRGKAALDLRKFCQVPTGMLAVGLGPDDVQKYLMGADAVEVGCVNSPHSVTLSGALAQLEKLKAVIQVDGHFVRMLHVDLAYHSKFMNSIAAHYEDLLIQHCELPSKADDKIVMFSSVTGRSMDEPCGATYWRRNMESPVLFSQALQRMVFETEGADLLVEIGPSDALAGPLAQIKKTLSGPAASFEYIPASKRGPDAAKALFDVAGKSFLLGCSVHMSEVNKDDTNMSASVLVDLPNYAWNHSTKYWHESDSSKDWRFRQFPHHDLLGSKILGTTWNSPSWKKNIRVQDLGWLKDHRLGNDIVFPAAGYIAMAIEALYQKAMSTSLISADAQREGVCYNLRDVTFSRAMVLDESTESKVLLSLAPCVSAKDLWHNFTISSLLDGTWYEHCRGRASLKENLDDEDIDMGPQELKNVTPAQLWYKGLRDIGYNFGPCFQKQLEIESMSGMRQNRARVLLSEHSATSIGSPYPMHPTCIDGCLQSGTPSLWHGFRSSIDAVLVPALIDEIKVKSQRSRSKTGIANSSAEYLGFGRQEDAHRYKSHISVYDCKNGMLRLQVRGLRYHKLDIRNSLHASHTYTQLVWKPDISLITREQISSLDSIKRSLSPKSDGNCSSDKIYAILEMIAHKIPNLSVMEIDMLASSESIWFEHGKANSVSRRACTRHHLASDDAATMLITQEKYGTYENTEFSVVDLISPSYHSQTGAGAFDLVIVTLPLLSMKYSTNVVKNARRLLHDTGYVLFLISKSSGTDADPQSIVGSPSEVLRLLEADGFQNGLQVSCVESFSDFAPKSVYLATTASQVASSWSLDSNIHWASLSDVKDACTDTREALTGLGWRISKRGLSNGDEQGKGIVLILDELHDPTLSNISTAQWRSLQNLIVPQNMILWVTTGSQLEVNRPDNALVYGLARTLRAEDPHLTFITLDVESGSDVETISAIHRILHYMKRLGGQVPTESEYCERRGVLYINRVFPNDEINQAENDGTNGAQPRLMSLHDHKSCVRMTCERVGTLDSLQFNEVSTLEAPLENGFAEIDIHAAGLNFKDIAVTMGLVPADEGLLGLEGGGVIRRVCGQAGSLHIGQRVVVSRKGSFANRVQSPIEAIHPLPDWMSFEDAATLPTVYLVSLYGLIDLANTQPGQSVLIHSAAGGVGIAAIQISQYVGAEIYATVGTEEKRKFLIQTFKIPPERIFSSRSTTFAPMLMKATKGKGVNVILNSLSGELLDESWRCIADGGIMVEIGKQDILQRNKLSMEPFNRNASYRAIDISHDSVPLSTIGRLLSQIFKLLNEGHIKPIFPRKIFPFNEIANAFRYMRGGNHIGKVVISNGSDRDVQVPIRPAVPTLNLRPDVSYLIIGGLKGLCGSLAIFLARCGARYLTIMSRSGYEDERSKTILAHLDVLHVQIELVQGDVAESQDVRRMFCSSTRPIAGIIQGAMMIRDKIFGSMSLEDYHEVLRPKVKGTWNLHNIALEQNVPLEFFTILSSLSGVVGQKAQANYAAANVFLDSFSTYRRGLGLPACTVDLGVIEDTGYISERKALAKRLDSKVWTGIDEGLLHKIVRFSICQQTMPINPQSTSQMITGIPVPQKADSFLLNDPRFRGLYNAHSKTSAMEDQDSSKDVRAFLALLKAKVDVAKVLAAAIDLVNRYFTKSLGLDEPMDPTKALSGYGLDSLAAVEFRNWVRLDLGAEVTTLEIINAKTLSALCESIIAKIHSK